MKLNPDNHRQLIASGKGSGPNGIMFRSGEGDSGGQTGTDIMTEKKFGDCQVHAEFMIPEKSNSGIYFNGEYEIQIWSDIGTPTNKVSTHNTGTVYLTKPPPSIELSPMASGTTRHQLPAPRFDANGKKTQNAKFISVILNGKKIQENVDTPGRRRAVKEEKANRTACSRASWSVDPVTFA